MAGDLAAVWDAHLGAEFRDRDPDKSLATMTDDPRLLCPTVQAVGREAVRRYYHKMFLRQLPPDIEVVPVSRTVGASAAVRSAGKTWSRK